METLQEAYQMAKSNNGAPGIDGVTFEAIEESGVESFLKQIQDELAHNTYRPMPVRKKEIPKDGGTKVRVLSIPTIRDRVVQGALKHILEPIFEADFQSGSYGYRPKRSAHEAVDRVAQAIVQGLTRIIDLDLRAYFDNVQHSLLLEKVARRVQDTAVMRVLKMILKSTGAKGVPQGGLISPMLSNLYLTEVDRMLEKAIATTLRGKYPNVQYARFADDLVVLIDSHPRHEWLRGAVEKRLREEMTKLRVEINEEKSRKVDLSTGGSFGFLGFPVRMVYKGRTQNIGLNYLTSDKPIWYAGPDLIASKILTGRAPKILKALCMVPHGRQSNLQSRNLQGMVEINPAKDDFYRKVIEQRVSHKAQNKPLANFLKVLANSGSYGLFVEVNTETKKKETKVPYFSGERKGRIPSTYVEKPGAWYFPPVASLITSVAGCYLRC
jgi:group II intron reverse transcriptase/maturase